MPTRLITTVVLAAGALLAVPAYAQAQEDPGRLRDSDVYDHDASNYIWEPVCAGEYFLYGGCEDRLGDANREAQERSQAEGVNRWLRAGVMVAGQLWMAVDYARETYHGFKDLYNGARAIVASFSGKRPERTVLAMKYALDRFDRRLDQFEQITLSQRVDDALSRYDQVGELVRRGLVQAETGAEAAMGLSDQVLATQMALGTDGLTVRRMGDGAAESVGVLPPTGTPGGDIPVDYDGSETSAQLVARVAAEAPSLVSALQGAAPDVPVCDIQENSSTPEVVYHRASIQAYGAEVSGIAGSYDADGLRQSLRLVEMQEEERRRQMRIAAWVRMLNLAN